MKVIILAEPTSLTPSFQTIAHRVTEAEPKEEHNLHHVQVSTLEGPTAPRV